MIKFEGRILLSEQRQEEAIFYLKAATNCDPYCVEALDMLANYQLTQEEVRSISFFLSFRLYSCLRLKKLLKNWLKIQVFPGFKALGCVSNCIFQSSK